MVRGHYDIYFDAQAKIQNFHWIEPKNFVDPNFNHTKPKVLLKENFCLIEETFCLIEVHVVEKCFCIEEQHSYIDEKLFSCYKLYAFCPQPSGGAIKYMTELVPWVHIGPNNENG